MRAAPAVSVRCSGGWPWRLLRTLLPAVATAAVSAWLLLHLARSPAWAAVPSLGAAVLAWCWARPRIRQLAFDGQVWTCDGQVGQPEVMLDLDAACLLRWLPTAGAALWLPVTAGEAGVSMHAVRVALYAPQTRQQSGSVQV